MDNERVFLLDVKEARRASYGYNLKQKDEHRIKRDSTGTAKKYWLRSPVSGGAYTDGNVALVFEDGSIYDRPTNHDYSISPAMNLDLTKIILSSLYSGTAGKPGAEYRLSIKTDKMGVAVASGGVTRTDNRITVPYTKSGNTGDIEQVSILLMDKKYKPGEALTEGFTMISDRNTDSGEISFELPVKYCDRTCGSDYYAYLVGETKNERYTDYATDTSLCSVSIPSVKKYNINYSKTGEGTASSDKTQTVKGGEATITATPASGWAFKEWKIISGGCNSCR